MPALTAASRVNRTERSRFRVGSAQGVAVDFVRPHRRLKVHGAGRPLGRAREGAGAASSARHSARSPPRFNDPLRHAERACYEEEFAVAHRLLFASIDSYLDPASGAALATRDLMPRTRRRCPGLISRGSDTMP